MILLGKVSRKFERNIQGLLLSIFLGIRAVGQRVAATESFRGQRKLLDVWIARFIVLNLYMICI